MGVHDVYVKSLFKNLEGIIGFKFVTNYHYTYVKYAKSGAQIDGVIVADKENIAVEIESRTAKQVRGAILDLFFHKVKKEAFNHSTRTYV